jgi:hypothetical protein
MSCLSLFFLFSFRDSYCRVVLLNAPLSRAKSNKAYVVALISQVPYAGNPNLVTDHTYTNLTVATPLAPEEALAAFNGENPNGTWTLTVADDNAGDVGSLN